tara:strand:- start:106 stop:579 length:474 start_codon:yes stop_codon:yes gene_type:complete
MLGEQGDFLLMIIQMVKQPGGSFVPADDMEQEKTVKFKTFEHYEIDIKLSRNPAFLRKVMVFFKFCYSHWNGDAVHEFCTESEQFDRFRKDLTILAGFWVRTTRMNGETRYEAQSLSFASMTEEKFQECYLALIQAALKHTFRNADVNTENQLLGFF